MFGFLKGSNYELEIKSLSSKLETLNLKLIFPHRDESLGRNTRASLFLHSFRNASNIIMVTYLTVCLMVWH